MAHHLLLARSHTCMLQSAALVYNFSLEDGRGWNLTRETIPPELLRLWVQYSLIQSQTLIPPSPEPGEVRSVGSKERGREQAREKERKGQEREKQKERWWGWGKGQRVWEREGRRERGRKEGRKRSKRKEEGGGRKRNCTRDIQTFFDIYCSNIFLKKREQFTILRIIPCTASEKWFWDDTEIYQNEVYFGNSRISSY